MQVRPAKNGECTFTKTGVCNCKKEATESIQANKTSPQTNLKVKGVVTK